MAPASEPTEAPHLGAIQRDLETLPAPASSNHHPDLGDDLTARLLHGRAGWWSAAMLADVPMGESPIGVDCPVDTVVIPGGDKGDRLAGSPGVKVSHGEASNSTSCSTSEPVAPKSATSEVPSPFHQGEGPRHRPGRNWVDSRWTSRGLGGRHVEKERQRKHGSTWESPRRSRTARALSISPQEDEVAVCSQVGQMGSAKR